MSIQTTEQHSLTQLSPDKIELLKRTICKGTTNDELELFIHACNRTGLDPFMKQIYAIKRGNVMGIQTGIDGYRLIAERSGKYMPGKEPTFTCDDKGKVVSATSYVKKLASDGTWHEIGATALWAEYEGSTPIWKKMPFLMLSKCSESLALRRAFPAELSGIYTKEEMDQADEIDVTPQKALPSIISTEEALVLEEMVKSDPECRKKLLDYFSGKTKVEHTSFFSLSPDMHKMALNFIKKWMEKKQETKEVKQEVEDASDEALPF